MNKVEESTQVYSIKRINPKDDFGEIKLNTETDIIELYVGNVSNFVHELTHAGQYERGDLAFHAIDGSTLLIDFGDEVEAYKNQYAYDPSVLENISTRPSSMSDVNSKFVAELGYAANNLGVAPININSSKVDLMYSYCKNMKIVKSLYSSNISSAKDIPNIKYKK